MKTKKLKILSKTKVCICQIIMIRYIFYIELLSYEKYDNSNKPYFEKKNILF